MATERTLVDRLSRAVGWALAGVVVVILVAIPDPREFARARGATERLSVATGGTGGVWYPYGGGVAQVITAHVEGVEATAEVTAASVDNLKLLQLGRVDVAFTMADALAEAHLGEGAFERLGEVPVRTLAVLYHQPIQLVTVEGTGIESIGDLVGRIVSIGAPGSGTELMAVRILEAAGIDPRTGIRPQGLSVAESVNAIRDGKIDAFFWSSGLPAGAVLDLATSPGRAMRMLPTDETLPGLRERHGEQTYFPYEIPRSTYPGMATDIPSVGVASVLVAAEGLDEELAYRITRALFEHRAELVAIHPAANELSLASAVTGSPAPFHPGAIRYYRERGTWREE